MSWTRPSLLALVLMCVSGKALPAEPGSAGTVFAVGGVGGYDPLQRTAPSILPLAGVPHRIIVFEWTHGKLRPLRDIQDTRYLLDRADELAAMVSQTLAEEPNRPVYLMGHSAGAAIVLAAAEKLPPGSVERIILLSAAVSPTFNLCPALRAARREVVSFNSDCDFVWLGMGTALFGTADRLYVAGAGKGGFLPPDNLNEDGCRLYERLVQVPWRWESLLEGRGGGHNSSCMPVFMARHVAPWLMP